MCCNQGLLQEHFKQRVTIKNKMRVRRFYPSDENGKIFRLANETAHVHYVNYG
jgi:hypothetical protein